MKFPPQGSQDAEHAGVRSAGKADDVDVERPPIHDRRVLVVDDEEGVRSALQRFLLARGYDAESAGSASEALALIGRSRFALAIVDVRMPEMTGIELLPRARELDADLAMIMLTAVNDALTATESFAKGALDYLVKPVELPKLHEAVERALQKRAILIHHRDFSRALRDEAAQRTSELQMEKWELHQRSVDVAESLVTVMEAKDEYRRGHSRRVAELARRIAEEMALDPDVVEQVHVAARLHDVGNIGVPEMVPNKPAFLTEREFEQVKGHVRISLEILSPLSGLGAVLDYVRDHHERWDGSGYPRGLMRDAISIGGRILAAADAFEALTAGRPYRDAMDSAQAIKALERESGTLIDPAVFAALRKVAEGMGTGN